jgi:hypothetical protein
MELTTRRPRPIRMTHSRKVRGGRIAAATPTAAAAAALAVAVAGCGTYTAAGAGSGASSGSASGSGASTTSTTSATGCASVNEATKVTVLRAMHLVEPTRVRAMEITQTDPATVRALFRDFCQVVTHKDTSGAAHSCPMEIGLSYGGTFYDGGKPLATYTYAASGCQIVTVTAADNAAKPQSAMVFGTAATAAPSLESDMAKTLGMTKAEVFQPQTQVNQGSGPSK